MGYIKIDRALFDHEIAKSKPYCDGFAWLDLLQMAAWKPYTLNCGIKLQRGQLHTTRRFLAKRWGWSQGRVERFLGRATDRASISTTKSQNRATGGTTITILNYDMYQGDTKTELFDETTERSTTPENGATNRTTDRTYEKSVKQLKKNKKTDTLNGWAIWLDVNRERGRSDPMPEGADTRAAKTLKDRYKTEAALKGIYREFLDDQDKWLVTNCHALRFLPARVVKYENPAPKQTYVPEYDKVYPTEADAARYAEEAKRMSADEVQQYLLNLGITDGDAARRAFDYDRRTPSAQKTA